MDFIDLTDFKTLWTLQTYFFRCPMKIRSRIANTALLLVILAAGLSAEWLQFRGDPAATGVAASKLPKDLKIKWTYDAKKTVYSTPALTKTGAYIGCTDKFICLDPGTGKLLWTFPVKGEIRSSALVTGGKVFFGDDLGMFYALEAGTGKKLWEFESEKQLISSPACSGNKIIFGGYDGTLYALDAKDGRPVWKLTLDSPIHGSPALCGNNAVVAGCDGNFRFVDLATGLEKFLIPLESNIAASPAVYKDRVYVSSLTGKFFCADIVSRKILWEYYDENNEQCFSSPAVNDSAVVFGTNGNFLRCLEPATGRLKWAFTAGGKIESSPVIAGENVFFGSDDGKLYGAALDTGKKIFEFDTGSPVSGSTAVSDGKMVAGNSSGLIYCFGGSEAGGNEKH